MSNEKFYVFKCSPALEELITYLSKHIPGGEETLFHKCLVLMGVAMKAVKNGHKLAIVDENKNVLDTIEIV